jgi:phosphotriesterase-related protein
MTDVPVVQTLGGPLPIERLGRTLMHEHIAVLDHELMRVYPEQYGLDREAVVTRAAARLDALVDDGVDTIVDMTVLGLGRDVALMREVAGRTRMQVVAATGAYVLRDLTPTLQLRGPGRTAFGGPEPLTALFLHDLQQGMEGTGVRAGVLKCATDRFGMTKDCERVVRAVAQAHLATGALISTHSNAAHRSGLDQQRVLAEEGVSLDRVLIGHCGDTAELDYLKQLLDAGSSIGLDRFGLDYFLPHEQRLQVVLDLVDAGYADRLVLSHDASCHHLGYTAQEMLDLAPRHDLSLVPREVVPALLARGMAPEAVTSMLVTNPRRLLTPRH